MTMTLGDWFKVGVNTIVGLTQAGTTYVLAESQRDLTNAQKDFVKQQSYLLTETTLESKREKEDTQKAFKIIDKIRYKQPITQEEYDFVVSLGYDVGKYYTDYIDDISNPQDELQNENTNIEQQNDSKVKPYLLLTSLGIIGAYLILRRK